MGWLADPEIAKPIGMLIFFITFCLIQYSISSLNIKYLCLRTSRLTLAVLFPCIVIQPFLLVTKRWFGGTSKQYTIPSYGTTTLQRFPFSVESWPWLSITGSLFLDFHE